MNIDWAALGSVFGVSLLVTVGLGGAFALGIAGLSRASAATAAEDGGTGGGTGAGGQALLARLGAYACFGVCLAAVAFGIYVIVA
ncbi:MULTISPECIES: hypothetical protein [unclassified Streptomyces]|uniref:Secreted protein n=1 Tax=Streptomyces evansiae TaxID=3075535 RepID=A0ABD5EBJ8_9ACTN|nr:MULTISPECIES: hypothetical protein [unclassified Streptomyces]ASY35597.1 hypothetical protein CAC01_25345 [Streptomyces sp. CLI2509]EGJ78304.1 hypothetical protein STTU_5516 [Streptomyces sp. Tu6071]MDT0418595.1 hypothetical protein [Streptomyces sp. DSM 41982]MYR26483.1 hypothetical protein [Streptomyces sp. SID4945]NJA59139.1 hypothetical protein [Streptomyces sp. NEAU-H3]